MTSVWFGFDNEVLQNTREIMEARRCKTQHFNFLFFFTSICFTQHSLHNSCHFYALYIVRRRHCNIRERTPVIRQTPQSKHSLMGERKSSRLMKKRKEQAGRGRLVWYQGKSWWHFLWQKSSGRFFWVWSPLAPSCCYLLFLWCFQPCPSPLCWISLFSFLLVFSETNAFLSVAVFGTSWPL